MVSQQREVKEAAVKAELTGLATREAERAVAKVVARGVGRSVGERAESTGAELEAATEVDAADAASTDLEAVPPLW